MKRLKNIKVYHLNKDIKWTSEAGWPNVANLSVHPTQEIGLDEPSSQNKPILVDFQNVIINFLNPCNDPLGHFYDFAIFALI